MSDNRQIFYIIIGTMFLPIDEQLFRSVYIKNETCVSNNVFERKLYNGFKQYISNECFVFVSAPSFGWYPISCKKPKIEGFTSEKNLKSVSYYCFYLSSMVSKTKSLIKEIKSIIKNIDTQKFKICLILNEIHYPYLKCAEFLKKFFKKNDLTVIQFVPDLPEFNNRSKNAIYKYIKKKYCKKLAKLRMKYVDKYILFSEPMKDILNLTNKNHYFVNYGIVPDKRISCVKTNVDSKIHCVFLGKMDNRNGIGIILEAANILSYRDDIVFDLYGIGASDSFKGLDELKEKNVKVHGFVNPSNVLNILQTADVFLSPRLPNEEYTKYSFPSKLFDYLVFNKPVITFKLDCYPSILDKVFTYPSEVSGKALANSILSVLNNNFKFDKDLNALFLNECSVKKLIEKIEILAK